MAFKAIQLTAGAAQAAIVQGAGAGQFSPGLSQGTLQDPVPVSIKNEDAALIMWWGGPDVSATKGQSIAPGATVVMNLFGTSEVPWVFGTGGTFSVLLGRQ